MEVLVLVVIIQVGILMDTAMAQQNNTAECGYDGGDCCPGDLKMEHGLV